MLYPIYDREQRANKPVIPDLQGYSYANYSYAIMASDDIILKTDFDRNSYVSAINAVDDVKSYIENTIFNKAIDNRLFLIGTKGGFKFTGEPSISIYSVYESSISTDSFFIDGRKDNITMSVYNLNSDNTKGELLCRLPCFYSDTINYVATRAKDSYPSNRGVWNFVLGIKYRPDIKPAETFWNSSFNGTKVFVSEFPRSTTIDNANPVAFYNGTLDANFYGSPPKAINTSGHFACGVNIINPPPEGIRWLYLPIDPPYRANDTRYGDMTYPNFMPIAYENDDLDEVVVPKYLQLATFWSRGQGLVHIDREDDSDPNSFKYLLTFPYTIGTAQRINESAYTCFRDSLFPFFTGIKLTSNSGTIGNNGANFAYMNNYYYEINSDSGIDISNKYIMIMTSGYFNLHKSHKFVANAYFGSDVRYPPKENNSCRQVFTNKNSAHAIVSGRKYSENANKSFISPYDENAKTGGGCGNYGD